MWVSILQKYDYYNGTPILNGFSGSFQFYKSTIITDVSLYSTMSKLVSILQKYDYYVLAI